MSNPEIPLRFIWVELGSPELIVASGIHDEHQGDDGEVCPVSRDPRKNGRDDEHARHHADKLLPKHHVPRFHLGMRKTLAHGSSLFQPYPAMRRQNGKKILGS